MSQRYAVVNADGVAVNIIIAEPDFDPGEGLSLVLEHEVSSYQPQAMHDEHSI